MLLDIIYGWTRNQNFLRQTQMLHPQPTTALALTLQQSSLRPLDLFLRGPSSAKLTIGDHQYGSLGTLVNIVTKPDRNNVISYLGMEEHHRTSFLYEGPRQTRIAYIWTLAEKIFMAVYFSTPELTHLRFKDADYSLTPMANMKSIVVYDLERSGWLQY